DTLSCTADLEWAWILFTLAPASCGAPIVALPKNGAPLRTSGPAQRSAPGRASSRSTPRPAPDVSVYTRAKRASDSWSIPSRLQIHSAAMDADARLLEQIAWDANRCGSAHELFHR